MRTNRQLLGHIASAAATSLAGPSSVDLHHRNTGTLSLLFQDRQEAVPGSIRNCSGQPAVLEHLPDVQAFHSDKPEATYEVKRGFVRVVVSKIIEFDVNAAKAAYCLFAVAATILLAGDGSTGPAEFGQGRLKVAWVGQLLAVRCSKETGQPNIHADGGVCAGHDGNSPHVTRQDNVPLVGFSLDGCCLDGSFDRPVNFAFDHANMLDAKPIVLESDAVAVGRKLNRVEPILGLESWKTWFLSSLDTPKESVEGLFQSTHGALGTADVEPGKPRIDKPLVCEPRRLIVIVNGNSIFLVSQLSLFEASIVKSAVRLKSDAQFAFLVSVRIKSELVCFTHRLFSPGSVPIRRLAFGANTDFGFARRPTMATTHTCKTSKFDFHTHKYNLETNGCQIKSRKGGPASAVT